MITSEASVLNSFRQVIKLYHRNLIYENIHFITDYEYSFYCHGIGARCRD